MGQLRLLFYFLSQSLGWFGLLQLNVMLVKWFCSFCFPVFISATYWPQYTEETTQSAAETITRCHFDSRSILEHLNQHQYILPPDISEPRGVFPKSFLLSQSVCFYIYRNPGLSFQSQRPFIVSLFLFLSFFFTLLYKCGGKKDGESG